jgi:hypothetical protein
MDRRAHYATLYLVLGGTFDGMTAFGFFLGRRVDIHPNP